MRPSSPARPARWIGIAALATLVALAALTSGCKSRNEPITESKNVIESTGTVQATDTFVPTPTVEPSSSTVPTVVIIPAPGAGEPQVKSSGPKGFWPDKVGGFAASFKYPVWYPKTLPAGYKVDSLDVVELEPGAGLVCDIVYMNGDKMLGFTQGSPASRDYEIVSVGKTPWGNKTADVVHEDPSDTTSAIMIVLVDGGNLAELYGDVSPAELKAVAASMAPVK